MKFVSTFFVLVCLHALSLAQAPAGLNYQAVIRDNGALVTNSLVEVKFTISANGSSVYEESQTVNTTEFGMINAVIGEGTSVGSPFSTIDWSATGPFMLNVQARIGLGAFDDLGTQEMVSVPFSMYADKAETVVNDAVNDADADPTNELQTLSVSGDNLSLSDGGGSVNLSGYEQVESGLEFTVIPFSGATSSITDNNIKNIGSLSLTAPAAGYVVLVASANAVFFGGNTTLQYGFSTNNNTFNIASQSAGELDSSHSLRYDENLNITCVAQVSSGTTTFYFNAQRPSVFDSNNINIGDLNLTAMFFPNRY